MDKPPSKDTDEVHVLNLYQPADKIYTRHLEGFYRKLARWTWLPMLAGYFLLPWLSIDGHQAVWFDLAERKFYIFWMTFWPQDAPMLAALLIISAFGLFTITNFLGRVWCGFSCPQTVWTRMFISIEKWFEGERHRRIKLDAQPWGVNKLWRKVGKQFCWGLVALATGITFVGYFNPVRELIPAFLDFSVAPAALFWTALFTALTWANAGLMREQICLYVCPYARFQSVMFDPDTLIVSYNKLRGELRGSRKKQDDPKEHGLGDCVDCTLCVQVCPTGIDIRDGLQYECISCGLCIDACNAVMEKMEYPKGLISFTTENMLNKGDPFHWFRPRLIAYFSVLVLMCGLFVYSLGSRIPLEVDIIRDRINLYRITPAGLIENSYQLKINNMDQRKHKYQISISDNQNFSLVGQTEVSVEEGEVVELLIRLTVPREAIYKANTDIQFAVSSLTDPSISNVEQSRFLAPAGGFSNGR
jgi:cytochrome c oxidase accessory protein FixG